MRQPQQPLHESRPVLTVDLHQSLEFPEAMRITPGVQDLRDRGVRRPVVIHQYALEALQHASPLPVCG